MVRLTLTVCPTVKKYFVMPFLDVTSEVAQNYEDENLNKLEDY